MNTQKFVEDYVKSFKSKFLKFFVTELIFDAIEMAAFVFAILKLMDTISYVYICIAVFVVILNVTLFLNMKKFFGSFKELVNGSNIYRNYNDAAAEFQKTNDQARFDTKLSELELMIKK